MKIKKIVYLVGLLSFGLLGFVSCKQNNTAFCNPILSEDAMALLGVWQTKFQCSETKGYQAFPYINDDIHTYEYLAFSQTGKAHFAIRRLDYKNQETSLSKAKTFDFVAGNGAMKWKSEDGEQLLDFLFDGDVLTVILRDKERKLSVYSYQKTKGVLLRDIENAEFES